MADAYRKPSSKPVTEPRGTPARLAGDPAEAPCPCAACGAGTCCMYAGAPVCTLGGGRCS